jgi:hypothetical protein
VRIRILVSRKNTKAALSSGKKGEQVQHSRQNHEFEEEHPEQIEFISEVVNLDD